MPEGPEVRALVDQLQAGVGRRLLNIQFVSGRYVTGKNKPRGMLQFAKTMTQKQPEPIDWYEKLMNDESENNASVDIIKEWNCKGKFIYIILDDGKEKDAQRDNSDFLRSIWITLGMSGRFLSQKAYRKLKLENDKMNHVRWYLELLSVNNSTSSSDTDHNDHNNDDQHAATTSETTTTTTTRIYYSDMRNFGTVKFCLSRRNLMGKLQSLGPDMLTTCTEQDFLNVMEAHRDQAKNICRFLMAQKNVCGIGNYILAEGLYRANIDPFAALRELDLTQRKDLFRELKAVTTESYKSQTAADDNSSSTRSQEEEKEEIFEYQCYRQHRCKQRGDIVRKEMQGPHGRTIWYTDQQLFMPRSERKQSLLTPANNFIPLATTRSASTMAAAAAPPRKRTATAVAKAETSGNAKLAAILGNNNNSVQTATASFHPSGGRAASSLSMKDEDDALLDDDDGESLASSLLSGITDPGWSDALRDTLQSSDSFQKLAVFLEEERLQGAKIYPPRNEIFAALNLCPLNNVKVTILGQDPYHGAGQGHGLAFSVRKGVKAPPSLQNIFKEAMADVGIEAPKHGNLEHWAKQGVLLLNAVLTVRQGQANSHAGKGWEEVTDAIIQQVCAKHEHDNDNKGGLVFLVWGNAALKKVGKVIDTAGSHHHHTVIQASHPSPLGATKTKTPFIGSKCFSRANAALIEMGKDPIDWNVDP